MNRIRWIAIAALLSGCYEPVVSLGHDDGGGQSQGGGGGAQTGGGGGGSQTGGGAGGGGGAQGGGAGGGSVSSGPLGYSACAVIGNIDRIMLRHGFGGSMATAVLADFM